MIRPLILSIILVHGVRSVTSIIDAHVSGDSPLCWMDTAENATSSREQMNSLGNNDTESAGSDSHVCPPLDVMVLANTSQPLYLSVDYTYQLQFLEHTSYETWYNLIFCPTEQVRYCSSMKAKANGSSYLESPITKWPAGADLVNVTFSVDTPGTFVVFGHVTQQINPNQTMEVSQTIRGLVILVETPPETIVLTNSDEFFIFVVVLSSIYASILLAMMVYIIRNRKHPFLKLAQAPFLALIVACAVTTTASTILYIPINNISCQLQGIFIFFPLTVLASTLVGRIWRTYCVMAGALQFARSQDGDKLCRPRVAWVVDLLGMLAFSYSIAKNRNPCQQSSQRRSLRAQVNEVDLTCLIIMLSLPQFVAQIVGLCVDPQGLSMDSIDSGLITRQTCDHHWTLWMGLLYLIFVFILALVVAWEARELPSILNEKDAIFQACSTGIVLGLVGILCIILVSSPTTNPDVISFFWIIQLYGIVSSVVWLVVWPPIARAKKGGTIIVSNLLKQQSETLRSETQLSSESDDAILLKRDDAPPPRLEGQMVNLKNLLQRLGQISLAGDTISLKDWRLLKSSVEIFHRHLDRIQFDWTLADERNTPSSEHNDETLPEGIGEQVTDRNPDEYC